jgi:integrase
VITRDGTKKRRSVYGKTRSEAAEKLAAAIADRDRGLTFDAGTLTVGEHLDRYLEDARGRLRPKPFNRAEGLVRNHVKPALGNIKLKDLSPAHLRGLYGAKLDSGLSSRTVGYVHVTLYGALKQAVEDGLIQRNPAAAVKPPRTDGSEMTPLSPIQAKTLLDTARAMDDRWSALYVLAVTTGLRQGELLGLGWEDVDLGSTTLRVRHTLQPPGFPKGAPARLTPPKTRRSLRSVHLPHSAVGALLRHRELQASERSRSNGTWRDRGLVFPNTLGGYADYTNLMPRHFKPLLRRAGLPDIRFHDLRHTCATLLLTKGVHPKIVSEILGHSSIAITLDIYSHVIPGLGEAAALAMEDALGDDSDSNDGDLQHVTTDTNGIAGATMNNVFPKPHLSRLVQDGRLRSTSHD